MIKPSFGVPGALVSVFAGRWRTLAVGTLVGFVTWLPVVERYGLEGTFYEYYGTIAEVQHAGQDADDSRENPHRYDLINLRSWLYSWSLPRALTEAVYLVLGGVMIWALWKFRRRVRGSDGGWPYWSLAAAFLCLALYHRFYDASLLIVVIAALLARWKTHSQQAVGLGLPLVVFTVPGTALLRAGWEGLAEAPRLGRGAHHSSPTLGDCYPGLGPYRSHVLGVTTRGRAYGCWNTRQTGIARQLRCGAMKKSGGTVSHGLPDGEARGLLSCRL